MRHISTQNFLDYFPPGPAGIIRCVRFLFFAVSILTATRSLSYVHVYSFLFTFSLINFHKDMRVILNLVNDSAN